MAGVGIDIVEVARFRSLCTKKGRTSQFVHRVFSDEEQSYCFAFKDPAPHLAGMFAAKEAIQKALDQFTTPLTQVEVRHKKSGKPEIWLRGKRAKHILISISHTKSTACAAAFATR